MFQSSATIAWVDDPTNGSDPHSFRLQISSDVAFGSIFRQFLVEGTAGETTYSQPVDNLIGNTTYYARVMAINRAGVDTYQGYKSTSLVTTPFSVGPVLLEAVADQTRQIKVSWSDTGNSSQTRYQVDLSSTAFVSVSSSVAVGPGKFDCLFESNDVSNPGFPVLANTAYQVRVRPIYHATGLPETSGQTVSMKTLPVQPQNLYPTPREGSIDMTWSGTLGAAKNNSGTNYVLEWQDPEGTLGFSSEEPDLNATAVSLKRNTLYDLTVIARSVEGPGFDKRSSTSVVTLSDLPSQPWAEPSATTLTVHWNQGVNPDGTRYRVFISTSHPISDDDEHVDVFVTSHTFTNRKSNQHYWFGVKAFNSSGLSTALSENNSYTYPAPPPITAVDRLPTSLTFHWDPMTNVEGTRFFAVLDALQTGYVYSTIFTPPVTFTPNSRHDFMVAAMSALVPVPFFSASTSVWTTANVPEKPNLEEIVNLTTFVIKFFPGDNPLITEYAIQVVQDPDQGASPDGKYLNFLQQDGATIAPSEETPVWRTMGSWGIPQGGGYRVKLTGVPTGGDYFLQVKARNQEGIETLFGPRMQVQSISGVPSVKLLGESGNTVISVPTDSVKSPLYLNWRNLRFTAEGSGHFNYALSANPAEAEALLISPASYPGWNGLLTDGTNCGEDGRPPLYAGAMPGFCVPGEGIFYFHIIGNVIEGGSLQQSYAGTPSFRVYIDTTPPFSGPISATSNYPIEDNGAPLGLTTLNFSWPVIDGGESSSRSPIVGWSYSFSLNDDGRDPPKTTASAFVRGPSLKLRLEEAEGSNGTLPSTGTYFFKVLGVDQAGNWQPTATVFRYNFKEDSVAPTFKGVSLQGAKMPKAGYVYAAVPVDAPIQINFSEPMNFSPALGGIQMIQTHNSRGRLSVPRVMAFQSTPEDRGASTAMVMSGLLLEPGSRYEIHSSTSNLFDLGGNPLPPDQKFDIVFFTQLDPTALSVFESEEGRSRVEVSAGALGSAPSGVAFDGRVKNDPMTVGDMVRRASAQSSRRTGGAFNQVLDTIEYNQFAADGTLLHAPFLGPVTLRFKYFDDNGDGIEDRSEPGHPIKVEKLSIVALDQETGVWMRMPASRVSTAEKEVSVELRHFSVYALMGAGDFDLTDAHVFPVPFRAKKDNFITFVFPNAQMATVKIFTLDGRLVKTLSDSSSTGSVKWDPVANEAGEPVGSDVYLYVIENEQERKVGKLMVIR